MAYTILILGGTSEALLLAERLARNPGHRVITSLAGRTRDPEMPDGETRIGGFGGVEGLATFLEEEKIDLLIDATHPFAETISLNAAAACEATGTRRMGFVRPQWQPLPDDNWVSVSSLEAAAGSLPAGATAFLALGHQYLAPFTSRKDVRFIIRMVDPPETDPPFADFKLILSKPSRDPQQERDLFEREGISHLVCRNSGGKGAAAKLAAARELRLPVLMIARPAPQAEGEIYSNLDALLSAIASR